MDSMAESRDIYDYDQLLQVIEGKWERKIVSMELKKQGYDDRIKWKTWLVVVTFSGDEQAYPVGYTNGDLSSIF